ncbi:hypothetical protein [Blastochloris sulfoviridis]|uniref:hypothetical protein n=1 Tax=Blastochloris sulfoviridis TaxID=50712 RepID=UPI001FE505CD|nr:hypothetical protein [Blastochloris sulfoviridis]
MRRLRILTIAAALAACAGPEALAQQNCVEDFARLRQDAEKRAGEVKAAGERKVPPREMCQAIRRFAESEAKVVKYLEENQPWCQIPPQVVAQAKNSHARTLKARTQVCSAKPVAAPDRPAKPSGPGIGSLSGPTGIGGGTTNPTNPGTQGSGIFSTLGGSSR